MDFKFASAAKDRWRDLVNALFATLRFVLRSA